MTSSVPPPDNKRFTPQPAQAEVKPVIDSDEQSTDLELFMQTMENRDRQVSTFLSRWSESNRKTMAVEFQKHVDAAVDKRATDESEKRILTAAAVHKGEKRKIFPPFPNTSEA